MKGDNISVHRNGSASFAEREGFKQPNKNAFDTEIKTIQSQINSAKTQDEKNSLNTRKQKVEKNYLTHSLAKKIDDEMETLKKEIQTEYLDKNQQQNALKAIEMALKTSAKVFDLDKDLKP